jgi:hypothetical protein
MNRDLIKEFIHHYNYWDWDYYHQMIRDGKKSEIVIVSIDEDINGFGVNFYYKTREDTASRYINISKSNLREFTLNKLDI